MFKKLHAKIQMFFKVDDDSETNLTKLNSLQLLVISFMILVLSMKVSFITEQIFDLEDKINMLIELQREALEED